VEETVFDHSHIAGGISKIQTADNVLGIHTSRALKERGKYQIQLMKTRNSSGVDTIFELDFNIDTLRITDSGEEFESFSDMAMSKSTKLINDLTRKSTVEATPAEPAAIEIMAAPKVITESTKLRALLVEMQERY
jgi:hypothetical protein